MIFEQQIVHRIWLIATLLICTVPTTVAASRFIAGTDVSRDAHIAKVTIRFNCLISYVSHQPAARGDRLRVRINPTSICSGVTPSVADAREQYRPVAADLAKLADLEYDGEYASDRFVTLNFNEVVGFDVDDSGTSDTLTIRIYLDSAPEESKTTPMGAVEQRRINRQSVPTGIYIINLESSLKSTAIVNLPDLALGRERNVVSSEVVLDGRTWYRHRVGIFQSLSEAKTVLEQLQNAYPGAWIDEIDKDSAEFHEFYSLQTAQQQTSAADGAKMVDTEPQFAASGPMTEERIEALMSDGRRAMTAGEFSRAVQIYTKVLQHPGHGYLPEAQEFLALARERNGQIAHAKIEYERFLALYPDDEAAVRVNQRLFAILAGENRDQLSMAGAPQSRVRNVSNPSDWRIHTFFSQYYRRFVNEMNSQGARVNQSAIFSDMNLDARHRGARFDFNARLSAGYLSDLMNENEGPGNNSRVSYAYVELADAKTNLRGRVGRQSRHTGGVLGRFDGLNLGYQATEKILINTVYGKPVNSSSDGIDDARQFYGVSANYGPIAENLEVGVFYIQQDVDGITDRQAIGAEMRYFDARRSLWGFVDYDTYYSELGSYFLRGTWRFESRLTINGTVDHRMGPYLTTSNALIGQPFETISELRGTITDEEIRQLALDRTSSATTYTLGLSSPLTPRLQISANITQASIDGTPESGGVAASESTKYSYFSTSLVASSLFKEGDVSIIGLRYSESSTTTVQSVTLDSRFPLRNGWRINPRLRVDRREITSDSSEEWIYSPLLRIQYRWGRRVRIQFEVGKQFASRKLEEFDMDRESSFVNVGYQAIF